jgi:hypothetical protein
MGVDGQDCICGCERYGNCSWSAYWRPDTTGPPDDENPDGWWEPGWFDFQAMPDTVVRGLGDGYDDRQIDALVDEVIRLRTLERARARLAELKAPNDPS